jgi:hypothetical protein
MKTDPRYPYAENDDGICEICGEEECPGIFDPEDCPEYDPLWDEDLGIDEGEWLDEDDYARHQDVDD